MAQFFAFLLLLASVPARADGFVCPDFDGISFKVEDCDDNEKLGRAALACVEGYYHHVQQAQAGVLARFQAQIAKLKDQQSDSFDRTQAGYDDARKQLDVLIGEGQGARAAVDSLYLNMSFPEDYDEPSVTGMSTQAYLASQECYAVPQRVMLQSQAMIDKMTSDLGATQTAMLGKQSSSGKRSAQVQVLDHNPEPSHTSGVGSARVPSGASRNGSSDITGIKPKGAESLPK